MTDVNHMGTLPKPAGSPIENVAAKKPPTVGDSELYTVDKDNETVFGLVNQYSDKNNAVMQREAQKGIDMAAARGLTNSSIASGNAIGKVLDKTTEWATADSATNNARKTESLRAATSKYGTDVSADASKYGSDKQLEGTQYGADKQLEGTKVSADAHIQAAGISAAASVESSRISAAAQVKAQSIAATSNEKISAASEANKLIGHQVDLVSVVLSNASQEKIATIRSKDLTSGNKATAYSSNQASFLTGVANIDQTASGPSQQEQYDRLENVYNTGNAAIDAWS